MDDVRNVDQEAFRKEGFTDNGCGSYIQDIK